MLADNDPDFLEVAREFMELSGYRVVCASNPEQAVRLLREVPIAVAFIDARLQDDADNRDRSGLEVVRETRDVSSAAKVIMAAGRIEPDYVRQALMVRKGGRPLASDFISKADGLQSMLKVVESRVSRARVFLSYAPPDRQRVLLLYQQLEAAGFTPWMDRQDIPAGEDWARATQAAIDESDFVLFCLSRNSLDRRGRLAPDLRATLVHLSGSAWRPGPYLMTVRLEPCDVGDEWLQVLPRVYLFEGDEFQSLARVMTEVSDRRDQSR
jgi:CheY-like chemotaxis protein